MFRCSVADSAFTMLCVEIQSYRNKKTCRALVCTRFLFVLDLHPKGIQIELGKSAAQNKNMSYFIHSSRQTFLKPENKHHTTDFHKTNIFIFLVVSGEIQVTTLPRTQQNFQALCIQATKWEKIHGCFHFHFLLATN